MYWYPDTRAKEVHGPIRDKWVSLGREGFGYPITDEFVTKDGTGRFNYFKAVQEPGKLVKAIFWSLRTGAHPVSGPILTKWAEFGFESTLGFPIEDEKDRPGGGRIQRFQKGIITWTPQTGASVEEMTTS
ncbi:MULTISPECIES: LGFP repeat-containing protein [unclassified Bacillus (in: firmicutes)]|uniref:LGFP repeat-containing protein n=1 Tax=unclassified Bacillus (in: firmicutes) TaxID=185979 RepID=UPI0035A92FBF